jgi:hypothetical protein
MNSSVDTALDLSKEKADVHHRRRMDTLDKCGEKEDRVEIEAPEKRRGLL